MRKSLFFNIMLYYLNQYYRYSPQSLLNGFLTLQNLCLESAHITLSQIVSKLEPFDDFTDILAGILDFYKSDRVVQLYLNFFSPRACTFRKCSQIFWAKFGHTKCPSNWSIHIATYFILVEYAFNV